MVRIQSLARRGDLPYDVIGSLGHGGFGSVMEATRRSDGVQFALKIMYTQRQTRPFILETLREEVKAIEALQDHRHFIQVYAAYEAPMEVGLVTWPVADHRSLAQCLEEFLSSASESTRRDLRKMFHRAFGCLTNSLAWMHEQRFRHKDIKPANILVHQGMVLYCDFGRSLDSRLVDSSTTEGPARATRKYMAPEVLVMQPRNSGSDVFSLGCVIYEMVNALEWNVSINTDSFSDTMKEQRPDILRLIEEVEVPARGFTYLTFWLGFVMCMTHDDPLTRWSARQIASHVCRYSYMCCNTCFSQGRQDKLRDMKAHENGDLAYNVGH